MSPKTYAEYSSAAHDVSPEWHVRMQAAFQKHCDSSISKTINFPATATKEDVATIYTLCYESGCKGVTVYRDGCRQGQPMSRKKSGSQDRPATDQPAKPEAVPAGTQATPLQPVDLGEISSAVRTRQLTPFGNMHIQITVDPKTERELEVFAQLGKGGDLANSDLEAICRMVSLWLRSGGALIHVIRQLKGIGSSLQVPTKEGKIMSLGDGLARALEKYQRAKNCFGLKSLLLGDFDLAELKPGAIQKARQHKTGPTATAKLPAARTETAKADLRSATVGPTARPLPTRVRAGVSPRMRGTRSCAPNVKPHCDLGGLRVLRGVWIRPLLRDTASVKIAPYMGQIPGIFFRTAA